jgi:hypothetical protein
MKRSVRTILLIFSVDFTGSAFAAKKQAPQIEASSKTQRGPLGNGTDKDDIDTPDELSSEEIEFTNSFDVLNDKVSITPPPRKKTNRLLRAVGGVNSPPAFWADDRRTNYPHVGRHVLQS